MTGYARDDAVGRNCRFLQCEASDPTAILQMGEAMRAGERARVTLYNQTAAGAGFWNCVSLHPVPDRQRQLRYFVGILIRFSSEELRLVAEHKSALAAAATEQRERAAADAADPETGLRLALDEWRDLYEYENGRPPNAIQTSSWLLAAMSDPAADNEGPSPPRQNENAGPSETTDPPMDEGTDDETLLTPQTPKFPPSAPPGPNTKPRPARGI